ncbi:C40 family peptidase [Thomasclavelia cocleata]|uniref:C40 family peptidase n=1 Tax=Thomasclavelia cocleata TaxID=69824 RepID=UPI00242F2649|nr:NlpC/P60 family protein [Thomasclavelia cocleata]
MNDSEIKKNQVHDLSDASGALSAEVLAVSKGIEKLPSVGIEISSKETVSRIKTINKDKEEISVDKSKDMEFVFNKKRSGIKTKVSESLAENKGSMYVSKNMIKTRVANVEHEKTVYNSIDDKKIVNIETKDTRIRLAINTGTVSKGLKKTGSALRKTSKLIKSGSNIQNGESTIDKEVGKSIVNLSVRKGTRIIKNKIILLLKKVLKKLILRLSIFLSPLIIPVIIICVCGAGVSSVFGSSGGKEIINQYENYCTTWSQNYDSKVGLFEQNNPNGSIICNYGVRGRCDWKAVLSLIQAIFEEPSFSEEEKKVLSIFENQNENGLYETHIETNVNGVATLEIKNATFDDYVDCLKKNSGYINSKVVEEAKEYYNSENLISEFSVDFQVKYGSNNSIEGGTVVSGNSALGNAIANKALTRLGYMYVWGGCHSMKQVKDPNWTKFDCSGLICWAYYQAGANIGTQTTKSLSKMGKKISFSELQAGDILLYSKDGTYNGIHHVTLYIGGGRVVHAPQAGKGITTKSVESDKKHLYSCRRLY